MASMNGAMQTMAHQQQLFQNTRTNKWIELMNKQTNAKKYEVKRNEKENQVNEKKEDEFDCCST